MRPAAAGLLFVAASLASPVLGQQCGYDNTYAREVSEAATLGLRTMPLGKTHHIVVNATTPPGDNEIAVEILPASCPDAPRGHVCAGAAQHARIRCAAEELDALVKGDQRAQRASPALLYLITHELGHIQQGVTGSFEGNVVVIDLAANEDSKMRRLRALCPKTDAETARLRRLEEDADAKALVALTRAADLDRYRDPQLSPQVAVDLFVERLRIASHALSEWESGQHPELAVPTALIVQTMEPTPENLEQTSRRLLCQIRTAHAGKLAIPNAPDIHPNDPARLAAISVPLLAKARTLPGGPLAKPPEAPDTRQVEILVPTISTIGSMFDVKGQQFYDRLWTHLCEHYLNPQQWPDCSAAAFHDGTPECPLLLAIFDDSEIAASPARVTLRATAAGFETDQRIAAIAPAAEGVLIALAEPNAVVEWHAPTQWTATSMPCEPRSVTQTAAGYAVLCSNFDHVQKSAAATLRYSKFHTARLNDQRVAPGQLEGSWVGSVGGKLVATVTSPDEGRSMAVEITRDGARSLDAWRTAGCEKLRSGFLLAEGGGMTLGLLGTLEVARFTSGFGRLRDLIAPDELQADHDDLGPVIACAIRPSSFDCLDTRGTVFDPFALDAARRKVALSERLQRSRVVHGRAATAADRTYFAVWDAEGWELHEVRDDGRSCVMHHEETATASIDLVAQPHGVIVLVNDGTHARLIQVNDCL